MKNKSYKKKLTQKEIVLNKKKSGFIKLSSFLTEDSKKLRRQNAFPKKAKQNHHNGKDGKNNIKTNLSKTEKQKCLIQMKSNNNTFGNSQLSTYINKTISQEMVDTCNNNDKYEYNENLDNHIHFVLSRELNNDKFQFAQYRIVCEQYIALRSHINNKSKILKKALNKLKNEYDLLTCRMNIKYHVNKKFIYFMAVAHYLKKLKCLLTLFTEFIKTKDEDLIIDLYRKLKINMRLLFYVGRIVSNYATCIAYVRFLHDIVLSIFKIDKCLCELTALEPFKTIIPQLLNAMHIISNSLNT